eukprot:1161640-Pelagomonas_calceolata.AAC.8
MPGDGRALQSWCSHWPAQASGPGDCHGVYGSMLHMRAQERNVYACKVGASLVGVKKRERKRERKTVQAETSTEHLGQVYGSKPPAAGKKGLQAPSSSAAALREFVVTANISKRVCAGVDTNNAAGMGSAPPAPAIKYPMFMDENISSFFRRLSWSPDGEHGWISFPVDMRASRTSGAAQTADHPGPATPQQASHCHHPGPVMLYQVTDHQGPAMLHKPLVILDYPEPEMHEGAGTILSGTKPPQKCKAAVGRSVFYRSCFGAVAALGGVVQMRWNGVVHDGQNDADGSVCHELLCFEDWWASLPGGHIL